MPDGLCRMGGSGDNATLHDRLSLAARRFSGLSFSSRQLAVAVAVCTVVLGAFYIATCPVGHIPDVWEHVYRISGIVNGDVVARPVQSVSALHASAENVGGSVDGGWILLSNEFDDGYDPGVMAIPEGAVSPSGLVDAPYNNSAVNSPIAYLPQIVVFAICKTLGMSALTTYYLAEWGMLLVYAACMAACIAVMPRFRKLSFAVLLFPALTFRYSFAISADSFTLAMAVLFTGVLFSCAFAPKAPSTWRVALLAGCGAVLALTKMTYLPLVLLMVVLCFMKGRLSRTGKAVVVLGAAVSVALSLAWLSTTQGYVTTPSIVPGGDVAQRVASLKANPFVFVDDYLYAIVHLQSNNLGNSLMLGLFWLFFLVVFASLVVASVLFAKGRAAELRGAGFLFLWASFAACAAVVTLVYLALWMQYTPAGQTGVLGLQFRYANPVFFMMMLVLFWTSADIYKSAKAGKLDFRATADGLHASA